MPAAKISETRIILFLTCINLLNYLDRFLVSALGTLIREDFELSKTAFGLLGTVFNVFYPLASPCFGYLGDRFSRRRLMTGGLVLWSLVTSLTSWVTTYPVLVLTRGLVGIGEAAFSTLAPAYLADVFPLARRVRALGIFYVAIPLGAALAYLVGALLGERWGWRTTFLVGGLPGLALAALMMRLPAASPTDPLTNPPDRAAGAGPRPLLAAFTSLLRIRTLQHVTLGYGMITFALGGLVYWMPQYLVEVKRLSLTEANLVLFGVVALAGGLGTVSGGLLGGRVSAADPRAPLWVSGLGVVLAWPLAVLFFLSPRLGWYLPALVFASFFLFINHGLLTAMIVSVAGPSRRAQAVALNLIVIHLVGDVPSPALIGWVADLWDLQWGVSIVLVALAASALLLFTGVPHVVRDLTRAGELPGAPPIPPAAHP